MHSPMEPPRNIETQLERLVQWYDHSRTIRCRYVQQPKAQIAVPIVKIERPAFLDLAKAWPGEVIGTHLDARDDFRTSDYGGPQLIVMGSEGPGLSSGAAAVCTKLVKIPMAGKLDSLNLAIATALMLYQVRGPQLKL